MPIFKPLKGIAMTRKVLLTCGIFAGLTLCTQVSAAEGKFDHKSCYSGPVRLVQQGEGIIAGSYEVTGMSPGTEGTPYYNMSGRCLGQFTQINGDYNESGSCQFWNANGDKMFGVYSRKGDPAKAEGTWHVVNATGKLEGMTSDGKWMPISAFPPVPNVISGCNHEWGTWTTK
jgi:hypothetical protein